MIAAVAVSAPATRLFSYEVPPALQAEAVLGARVLVPFGRRRVQGIVVELTEAGGAATLDGRALLPIAEVLPGLPPIAPELFTLARWVAEYYEAPIGDVLRMALPVGSEIKLSRTLQLTPAGQVALTHAGAELSVAIHTLLLRAKRGLGRAAAQQVRADVAAAEALGLVTWDESRRARVREKTVRMVRLREAADWTEYAQLHPRAHKKVAALQRLSAGPITAVELGSAMVRQLIDTGLAETFDHALTDGRAYVGKPEHQPVAAPKLSEEQRVACEAILSSARPALLFGVTGSGKTEVYLHVIAAALARGQGAIVLVPEISLTPQLAARFAARFGDAVAVLHSGLSEQQRFLEWRRILQGEARIALGARSAIFAPVPDLGIIVIDEEHDASFKQEEGVRYHARNVALMRAHRLGIACVLGSATPSFESYTHAQRGTYTLLTMRERPTGQALPSVEVIDLRKYRPDGEAMLSSPLRAAIAQRLAAGEQTILFLNRRGHSTFILCTACGHRFRCPDCAVALTYHQGKARLLCHYCGFGQALPGTCPECAAPAIEKKGLGTERVALALAEQFPAARIARLDRDTASGLESLLANMHRRQVDILVGTQMVTKGHDFPGVTLVGVLCADTALELPDFRASERTFGLLSQVAGRAGRGDRPGHVLIQTYKPGEPAVACAATHAYEAFYATEAPARAELIYPPSGHMIAVRLSGRDEATVRQCAAALSVALPVDDRVLVRGPVPAPLARLRGAYRYQIWLRSAERAPLRVAIRALRRVVAPKSVNVVLDIDPMTTL